MRKLIPFTITVYYYFILTFFSACGIIPQLTIANSTMRKSINFETGVQGDEVRPINYTATLKVWQHYWEPQVPYTAVFEIPSNSRTLRKEMTLIEYQSCKDLTLVFLRSYVLNPNWDLCFCRVI